MASLTGTKIKDTYDALLKVSDNGALDGTLQTITDGLGNNSSLSLSTAGASVTGTLAVSGNATFDTTTLVVDAASNSIGIGITPDGGAMLDVAKSDLVNGATIRITNSYNGGSWGADTPIGNLDFYTTDLSGAGVKGFVRCIQETTSTTYPSGTYLSFGTRSSSNPDSAEHMRINSAGNIGIGVVPVSTSSGRRTLHIDYSGADGSLGAELRLTNSAINGSAAGDGAVLLYAGSDLYLSNKESGNVLFSNAGSEKMRISSSGFVGIGASSPLTLLHAAQTVSSGNIVNAALFSQNSGSNPTVGQGVRIVLAANNNLGRSAAIEGAHESGTNAHRLSFLTSANGADPAERMRIDSSGNVGINTQNLYGKLSVEAAGSHITLRANTASAGKYWALDVTSGNQFYLINNAGTQYLTMTDSGNVGIGTSTINEKVDIEGNVVLRNSSTYSTSLSRGFVYRSSTASYGMQPIANLTFLTTGDAASAITFSTRNGAADYAERLRISSAGNVLINCVSFPSASVEGFVITGTSSGNASSSGASTSAYNHLLFYNGNGIVGSISTSGSATAYTTSSDYRLKEDWQPMEGALDRVDALNPVNFAWKSSGDRVDGFLAHELAEVIPEAVTGEKDATEIRSVEVSPAVYEDVIHPAEEAILDEEGNVIQEAKEEWVEKVLVSEAVFEDQEFPVYQGIDQSKIVPLLVAAIQELRAEIESLKSQING